MLHRICIITSCNLKYAPYVKLYTDVLDGCGIEYDLVTWDKYNLNESVKYAYHGNKTDSSKVKTFFQYIGFGRFIDKILRENKYDRAIVCNPAPLIFVRKSTIEMYKRRFIWDIRDDTPIRKLFKKRFMAIRNLAACVVTSSRRYEKWIGEPTILSHNAQREMIQKYFDYKPVAEDGPVVRIINAGKLIEGEENIRVIELLGNSPEYHFAYYGNDVPAKMLLMEYCEEHQVKNVEFHGAYNKDEIVDIYRSQGSLINILRADTVINREALPNKLYEAAISAVPIVVYEHNTAIVEYVEKYYLGIVLSGRNELMHIRQRIREFDYRKYEIGRKEFLNQILSEIDLFESTVINFVREGLTKVYEKDSVCN